MADVQPTQEASKKDEKLRGISKSIIIGIGGTGHQILLDVRKRLIEKYSSLDRIPIVSFLQIDTSGDDLKPTSKYEERVNLDPSDKIHASVQGVQSLRESLERYPHLQDWLDPRALSGDIDQGAGAVRARGRLALFWNFDKISSAIAGRFQQVNSDDSRKNARDAHDTPLVVGEETSVYIVGSLLGGTGSGMFLDVAYIVRNRIADNPLVDIIGILTIPPSNLAYGSDKRPNAYAALLELNHYTDNSTVFVAQYGKNLPHIKDSRPPFKYCYLMDLTNGNINIEVDSLTQMVGHNIFLDLTSEFQYRKRQNRDNFNQYLIVPDPLECPQNFMSMGLSAIHFPKDKVKSACANRLAADILTTWTTPIKATNIPDFTQQELGRLGLLRDEIVNQLTMHQVERGEYLRDALNQEWTKVNRRYETGYPSHGKVQSFLDAAEQQIGQRLVESDPNPRVQEKRRENMGDYWRQLQTNLNALIPAKSNALEEWVSQMVNDSAHRHGVAKDALGRAADMIAAIQKKMLSDSEAAKERMKSLKDKRDVSLGKIDRYAKDFIMGKIPGATRKSIDEEKERFVTAAKQGHQLSLDIAVGQCALEFYGVILSFISRLQQELARYIQAVERLHKQFEEDEVEIVNRPVHVVGDVIFNNHDIDERYEYYVGGKLKKENVGEFLSRQVVSNACSSILKNLGEENSLYALRGIDEKRLREAILGPCFEPFKPIDTESVLEKFFGRYKRENGEASQTLRRVIALSTPFINAGTNDSDYQHSEDKEQRVYGVMNGSEPQSPHETTFRELLKANVEGLSAQNLIHSDEPHQVCFLQERAAFPLRVLANIKVYWHAYHNARTQGVSANPMHTRKDVREWVRIDPPTLEERKSAWETFVIGWMSGVITEETDQVVTVSGSRKQTTFSVTYLDNFGLPGSDTLGRLQEIYGPAKVNNEEAYVSSPPSEARDIIYKLCDDPTLKTQVENTIERQLQEWGGEKFAAKVFIEMKKRFGRLCFYKNLQFVISGRDKGDSPVLGYMVQKGLPIPDTATLERYEKEFEGGGGGNGKPSSLPSQLKCSCGAAIEAEFQVCPACESPLCSNPECKKPLKPEWKRCPHCKTPVAAAGPLTCPKGHPMEPGWTACPECE